jgi:hypothetical protein
LCTQFERVFTERRIGRIRSVVTVHSWLR